MALGQNNNVKAGTSYSIYVNDQLTWSSPGPISPASYTYEITSSTLLVNSDVVWTYSGQDLFLGFSLTQGATVPDTQRAVGDSGQLGLLVYGERTYLYIVTGISPRTISLSITNGTVTEFSHELTPDTGYSLPSSVTVTGASSSYSGGVVTLTNLTSSVSETAEASQGGSGSLIVTYNSSDIIDTTSDGTFTLPCSGKVMNSDIVISAENVTSLTVTYNNNNIINASNDTHTYTLSCNGKYMSSDIGISVTISSSSVVLHEQEGSTVYLYGAYTKTQSGSVVTIT